MANELPQPFMKKWAKKFLIATAIAVGTVIGTKVTSLFIDTVVGPNTINWLWQTFVLQNWLLWFVLLVLGAWWIIEKVREFHQATYKTIPGLMSETSVTAHQMKASMEEEKNNRVVAIDALSTRINNLDSRVLADLNTMRQESQSEFSRYLQQEAKLRESGMTVLAREMERNMVKLRERIARIETGVFPPQPPGLEAPTTKVLNALIEAKTRQQK